MGKKMKTWNREELSEEQIKLLHEQLDDLIFLYQQTHPSLGKTSETGKSEKALQALNIAGHLTGSLTAWAENQLFGSYYKLARSPDSFLEAEECNKHENETMWYASEYPEDLFEHEKDVECERLAIAEILNNIFGVYGRPGWRRSIAYSLQALNEGQVEWLLEPSKKRKQGNAFDIEQIKWAAIHHIYILVGYGWKKTAARYKVAEACGVSFEAVKKWEKQLLAERDYKNQKMRLIQNAATWKKKIEDNNGADFSNDKIILFTEYLASGEAEKETLMNMRWAFVTVNDILENMPLQDLTERLKQAGFRF